MRWGVYAPGARRFQVPAGKNRDFQQVHNALLKHLDQTGKCLEAFYGALGGDITELRRK